MAAIAVSSDKTGHSGLPNYADMTSLLRTAAVTWQCERWILLHCLSCKEPN